MRYVLYSIYILLISSIFFSYFYFYILGIYGKKIWIVRIKLEIVRKRLLIIIISSRKKLLIISSSRKKLLIDSWRKKNIRGKIVRKKLIIRKIMLIVSWRKKKIRRKTLNVFNTK